MKLLLPYAINSLGNLVHINAAHKDDNYTCPTCGAQLSLRISKIPKGQKYHRVNHFAHKGCADNFCSESFLHKLFKQKAAEYIRMELGRPNRAIWFEWECDKCNELHKGNLLKKATKVVEELDLQTCRPDIALLDDNNNVVIVIEIVVTHEPSPETLQFYQDNKIACLQIKVSDFSECDKIREKVVHPDIVNICPNPICKKCGEIMNSAKLIVVSAPCWRCSNDMKIAMIVSNNSNHTLSPADFTDEEIKMAQRLGVNIQNRYSQTVKGNYWANVCDKCNAFVGDFYMHEYFYLPHDEEIDLNYKCFNCMEVEQSRKVQEEKENMRKRHEKLTTLMMANEGNKLCPKCNGILKVRSGKRGPFYGCENYPNCKYTETIVLE